MNAPTLEQVKAIVLAEKEYWDNAPPVIGISGIGACANIFAALHGCLAPWHPKPTPLIHPLCEVPDHGRDL